jgi:predicted permease
MNWWRRKDRERDLQRELQADLELEALEQQARGLSPLEARRAAQRAFGNTALIQEDVRSAWGWQFFDRLGQDLRYALRGMRKSPTFTATAILSLALGIGANTAIFTLINAVMLRWLPVHDPQELVQVIIQRPKPEPLESFSYPVVQALSQHREIFSGLGAFSGARFAVGQHEAIQSVPGAWVSGGFYAVLGIQPAAGRLLTDSDDRPGAEPVAVITDGYWQRTFARSPNAIGQRLIVEGAPVTIVGVTPAGFDGANVGESADITLPLGVMLQVRPDRIYQLDKTSWWLRVLARPRRGLTARQAQAGLEMVWNPLVDELSAGSPGTRRRLEKTSLALIPGGTGYTDLRRQFRRPLTVLMAVVGLLLLIACANVANLLLARAAARQRELAVRLAIGASRARIVRQLLTEGLLLSLCGAALGVLFAWAGSRTLVNLLSSGLVLDVRPDWTVLAFTGATACATGVLFGIAPAFRGTATGPLGALREKISIGRSRVAPLLVSSQVAVALLLLIAGGLFVRTLRNLHQVDAGFRGDGVLLANADGAREGYRGTGAALFYEGLLAEIEALPGVRSASYAMITPLAGGGISMDIFVNGRAVSQDQVPFNSVSRGYFATMGTPLLQGREFNERDSVDAPAVAVVNQSFARRYLPAGNVLGQRVTVGTNSKIEYTVVGVVADAIYESLRESPPPTVYCPVLQSQGSRGGFGVVFAARAAGSLAVVADGLRATLQPKLPGSAVPVHAFTEQVERALTRERLMATLAASFGIVGLVLAAVGLYGLLAFSVARRTNEIGIRLALGATRREVLWMVLRHVLLLLGVGVAIGVPVAWSCSQFVSSMLFGVRATDLVTIGAAVATLTAAGIAAGFVPAWRASRVDPMVALRYE